jgi:hypothetical protein
MYRLLKVLVPAGLVVSAMIASPVPTAAQRSGVEIWAQSCGRCHRPQPARRYTAERWETIVAQMRIYARLTDDEANAVLEFLQGSAKPVAREESGADSTTVVADAGLIGGAGAADLPETESQATVLRAQREAVVRYMRALMSRRHP